MRAVAGLVVVAIMGCAIAGIGMGESPAEREAAPTAARVAAAEQRITAGGATIARGRAVFEDAGCDRCHSIAATGAEGKLGPRLDTIDEDLDHNLESIADPRDDIADGYPEKLMPADFADRLGDADLRAVAAFVTAASGGKNEESDDGGGGRGRGRGRGGSGDG
ncbi:MAG TPA: cytochrome c [Solirubrobacteraceae bacterium]|nr:cytochrome c [Solirubrobacteraceae bacterium]